MKTLIIDNFDSFTYNLFQYIAEIGGNPEVYRNNEISIDDVEKRGYTHIVISPGPGSPDNKKDFGICGKIIQHFKGRLPILGVCLGHQGIIHYLGGRVIRAPVPMHGKRSMIRINNSNALFKGLPEKIEVMRYHSLIGESTILPNELEITGETDDGLIMSVSHKTMQLYGVQFHPESVGTPLGKEILKNFFRAKTKLSMTEMEAETFIDEIASGAASEDEIEDILLALSRKGESVAEIIGMARGLQKHAVKLPIGDEILMDTCGTGGSGLKRMNISTTAAFVLAAAGVKIAKHGNRAASGRCGSFDLLEKLGVKIELPPETVNRAIRELGIGFIFAPMFHPVMKRVAPVRKKLGIRTIFNLLGPLVNPANPKYHLLGTVSVEIAEKMIQAMKGLNYTRVMVVVSEDGLDDVTITGKTTVYELHRGAIQKFKFAPEEAGLVREKSFEHIAGGDAEYNANLFVQLLKDRAPSGFRNLLLINAAFGFVVREAAKNLNEGLSIAEKIIESGAAYEKFLAYKKFSHEQF
ncbi:anthranilate phosphoribosyltransferase [Candidatus Peregrinibacteria bacterium]|nr:anthranilate phosphoribosyltransferase [Candidatus Peregrinibacteria bacterium]